jgi:hypothetical protein
MKTIAVIINGTRLPYHVIHHAINKAKENSCGILAVFLKGKHEPSRGYGFPSDMHSTESSFFADEVASEDEGMITDNMQLIKQMVEDEKISYQSISKTNARVDEVAEIVAGADLIVIDKNFDDPTLLGDDKISLKALKEKMNKPVDLVSADS